MNLLRNIILTILLTLNLNVIAQCTINSTCGYTVHVSITPTAIIPSTLTCPWGYNYNVTFFYSITVSGINTCWNGNIGVQPQIYCNGGQNNGYYTINVSAPIVGNPSSTTTYTGILTTTTNPYRNFSDCTTATPASLNCNSIDITIYGPGIPSQTISCNNTALPIELYTFDLRYNNKKVFIYWKTTSEINNDYFVVEKSKDGEQWEEVVWVDGAGNSNNTLEYFEVDKNPYEGVSYYRLKQVDFDGKYEFSEVRAVYSVQTSTGLIIYPNPTKNKITIQSDMQELKSIRIFNVLGQDVTTQVKQIGKSDCKVILDLSNLVAGLYTIKTKTTINKIHKQ